MNFESLFRKMAGQKRLKDRTTPPPKKLRVKAKAAVKRMKPHRVTVEYIEGLVGQYGGGHWNWRANRQSKQSAIMRKLRRVA